MSQKDAVFWPQMYKLLRFFRLIYIKLFRINDSPQRIALGFGVGVFLGFLPGTGPIAALCTAFIFRINRASSLLGSLLVNTWTSIITFLFAIKIGSVIMGENWQQIYNQTLIIFNNFHLNSLFKLSFTKIILPILVGYFVIATCAGIIAYMLILLILMRLKPIIKK